MGSDKGPKTQAMMKQCRDTLTPKERQASISKPAQNNVFSKAMGKDRPRAGLGAAVAGGHKRSKFTKVSNGDEHLPSPGIVTTESEKSIDQPPISDNPFWRRKIRRAFDMIDLDRDGQITRSDFDACTERYKQKITTASSEQVLRCKIMFEKESTSFGLTDLTTSMPLKAFTAKWAERVQRNISSAKHFEEMFKAIDLDDEGHIYYYQLYMFYRVMGYSVNVEDVQATFNAMDRDKDKLVSMADFVAYHNEYFYTVENNYGSSILYGPLGRD